MRLRPWIMLGTFAGWAVLAEAKPFAVLPWVTLEADETHWRTARIENMRALVLVGPAVDDSVTLLAYHAEKFTGSSTDYLLRAAATLEREFGRVTLIDQGQLWTTSLGPLDYRVWSYHENARLRFHVMYIFRSDFSLHRFEGMGAMTGYGNLRGQMDSIVSQATIDRARR